MTNLTRANTTEELLELAKQNPDYEKIRQILLSNEPFAIMINLEQILRLLNTYCLTKEYLIMTDGTALHKYYDNGQLISICEWIFGKPLYKQTPETWKKIANNC